MLVLGSLRVVVEFSVDRAAAAVTSAEREGRKRSLFYFWLFTFDMRTYIV